MDNPFFSAPLKPLSTAKSDKFNICVALCSITEGLPVITSFNKYSGFIYFCPDCFFAFVLPTIVLVIALLEATEKSKAALYFSLDLGA